MPVPRDPPGGKGTLKKCGGQGAGEVLPAFGPVETVPQQGPPTNGDLDTEFAEHGPAGRRDSKTIPHGKQARGEHPVPHGDTEPPGEVVVACAGIGQPASPNTGPQPTRRLVATVVGEPFDQRGNLGTDEPHVPMTPLLESANEPGIGENTHVLAGGGRRDPGSRSKLTDGPGTPVHQCETHGRPTGVSQYSGNRSELHTGRIGTWTDLERSDQPLDPLVDSPERVLAEHGPLRLVVQLEMHPVDREVPPSLLGGGDEVTT